MRKEMYVTPEMEVGRFVEEVVITVVSNGMSTQDGSEDESVDITDAGNEIGW